MKKLLLILVVFCIATATVSAQAVSEAKIRQQIEAAAASMKTMQCDFVQTKYLRMLNDKMVSRGKMYRNDVINVNQSKFFKEIARIMMNSVVGKALNDKRDFKVSLSSSATEYVAVLYPQQKQMQQMFQKIVLHFNRQRAMVAKVELIEKRGDRTVIEMMNEKVNSPIKAKVFTVN